MGADREWRESFRKRQGMWEIREDREFNVDLRFMKRTINHVE